ncbi:hypothetical protein HDV05_000949, partial [Chytridiales sp. JEL 0842]
KDAFHVVTLTLARNFELTRTNRRIQPDIIKEGQSPQEAGCADIKAINGSPCDIVLTMQPEKGPNELESATSEENTKSIRAEASITHGTCKDNPSKKLKNGDELLSGNVKSKANENQQDSDCEPETQPVSLSAITRNQNEPGLKSFQTLTIVKSQVIAYASEIALKQAAALKDTR